MRSESAPVAYKDLMKPDEDWRKMPNHVERRRVQNRIAQRAYRELSAIYKMGAPGWRADGPA